MGPDILHKHMIIRAEVSNPFAADTYVTEKWLCELVEKLKMKILMGPYVTYCPMKGNEGVTGVVIIETSHIALHIWDACNPAILQLDVYSCGELDEHIVFDHLKVMEPVKVEWRYIDRHSKLIEVKSGEY